MNTARTTTALALCLSAAQLHADIAIGWRDAVSTNVPVGASATLSGRLAVGDGGALAKLGAGTLEVEQSRIDRSAPYAIDVLEGTLSIVPGDPVPDAAPPAFVAEKAAFWVDATPGGGLQTADDGGTARVTRWCDVRESDPTARVWPSALPAYQSTGRANDADAAPAATTFGGNAAVYFGGLGSGQHMLFKDASDADLKFTKVFHFFLVHGIDSTWGAALGCTGTDLNNGFRVNTWANGKFTAFDALPGGHFLSADTDNGYVQTARFALDGQVIDAFSVPPRKGVQLLSGTLRDGFQNFNNFFRMRRNSNAIGGDYLCEVILFTNKLAEADFAQVERYLMAKWSLPDASSGLVHLDSDVGRIGVAAEAVAAAAPGDEAETGPLAFSGEGTVSKTGAGDLVIGPSGTRPPFAGDFSLEEGRVVVRGGMAPALSAGAGQTLDASYVLSTNVASPSAELQRSDGTALSISRGSGNAFVKTGGAEARVKAVGENVGAVRVEEGALVLAAPESASQFASGAPWAAGTGLDVSVPNAGFEEYFARNPDQYSFQSTALASETDGWHMTGYKAYFKRVNENWATTCKADIPPAGGEAVLFLKNDDAVAYTTVTLPKPGTYELSCVSSANKDTGAYEMGVWAGPTWGEAEKIAALPDGLTPWPRTYGRFTVAEAGAYVVGFKTGSADTTEYGWTIDEVALRYVPETTAGEGVELVANGGFEQVSGGFAADSSHWQNKSWRFRYADAASGVGGYNAYEGAYGMALRGKGAVTWTIAIPADGIYRLRFAAHERVDDRANSGRLPLRVTIAPEGGTETDIATVTPFCSNFNEYSVLFRASAGSHTLRIAGTVEENRRAFIDGVSVRAASVASAPSFASKPRLSVAGGARLSLDYPGEVTVSSLQLGGVSFTGTVTAATAPEFLQGIGSITVESDCTILTIR